MRGKFFIKEELCWVFYYILITPYRKICYDMKGGVFKRHLKG
jgi:hypothetical protein